MKLLSMSQAYLDAGSSTEQKSLRWLNMLRSILLVATAVLTLSATAATADNRSDCQKGVAMIKAELKKKHPGARQIAQKTERCSLQRLVRSL